MSGELLTIAIPTFNRSDFLDICLKRIFEELDSLSVELRAMVVIYISNNASTDGTDGVLLKYKIRSSEEFEIETNSCNIGAEENIIQCYKSAVTPYVWILGDDDVILSGGLVRVLNILKSNDIDVLYVNGYSYSDSYLNEPRRGSGENGEVIYFDALNFMKRTHIMLTFISAMIVRSGICIESLRSLVCGSNLPQMAWTLSLIRDGKKFAIIKNRIYAAKIANSGGYGVVDVFGSNLSNIASSMLMGYPKLVNALENGAIVTWLPVYVLTLRQSSETFSVKNDIFLKLKEVYKNNWRYYVFLVPLTYLPKFLVPIYYAGVRVARKLLQSTII